MPLPQQNERYTYADYCTWNDSERWELIEGVRYAMSPAPAPVHQAISRELNRQIANFLEGKPCQVYQAPFDVRLNADGEDDTVVQPDLLVICDRSKIDDRGCKGAPDLAIEILSPSTARRDRMVKLQQYQQAGVREYWIVDPDTKIVQVCILKDGLYFVTAYADTDTAPVVVLDGCTVDLPKVLAAE